jgi:hypothetical protein
MIKYSFAANVKSAVRIHQPVGINLNHFGPKAHVYILFSRLFLHISIKIVFKGYQKSWVLAKNMILPNK